MVINYLIKTQFSLPCNKHAQHDLCWVLWGCDYWHQTLPGETCSEGVSEESPCSFTVREKQEKQPADFILQVSEYHIQECKHHTLRLHYFVVVVVVVVQQLQLQLQLQLLLLLLFYQWPLPKYHFLQVCEHTSNLLFNIWVLKMQYSICLTKCPSHPTLSQKIHRTMYAHCSVCHAFEDIPLSLRGVQSNVTKLCHNSARPDQTRFPAKN